MIRCLIEVGIGLWNNSVVVSSGRAEERPAGLRARPVPEVQEPRGLPRPRRPRRWRQVRLELQEGDLRAAPGGEAAVERDPVLPRGGRLRQPQRHQALLVAECVQQLRLHHFGVRLVLGGVEVRLERLLQHPRWRRASLRLGAPQCA